MADAIVKLPDDSANTGPKVDNESLTVSAQTVNRQRIQVAGTGATDIAPVTAADGITVNLGANNDVTVASLPLPTGAATETTLAAVWTALDSGTILTNVTNLGGASAVNIRDGENSITVDAPVGTPVNIQIGDGTRTATVRDTGTSDSLNVAIVDGSGNQITTFGGGTEYTEGATDADITGTAMLMEGATNTLVPVQGTVADGVLVNLGNNNDVAVSGSVSISSQPGVGSHDSATDTSTTQIGGVARTALSNLTLVANDDTTHLFAGTDGVLVTRPHCLLQDIVTGNASNTDGASFSVIAASGDANIKHYLIGFTITNTSSSNIYCEIKDGATAKWTVPVPAAGGVTVNLPIPIPGTANTAWNCDPSAATTTVYASFIGFKSRV